MSRAFSPPSVYSPLVWFELLMEGDPYPRRYGSAADLQHFLKHQERLSDEAIAALLEDGALRPPAARRGYRLRKLSARPQGDT